MVLQTLMIQHSMRIRSNCTPQTPESVNDSGALLTYSQVISRNMPLPQYSLQSVMNVADLFESRFALLRWDPSTDKFIGYYSKKQIWVSGCGKLVDSFKRTGKLLKMIFPERFAPGNPELVMGLYCKSLKVFWSFYRLAQILTIFSL